MAMACDAVGGDGRVPASAGGDDGVQRSQDRRGDHRLGLGDGETVLLACGQMRESAGVDGVCPLCAPDGSPGREP
jgi:hypothetical protein